MRSPTGGVLEVFCGEQSLCHDPTFQAVKANGQGNSRQVCPFISVESSFLLIPRTHFGMPRFWSCELRVHFPLV